MPPTSATGRARTLDNPAVHRVTVTAVVRGGHRRAVLHEAITELRIRLPSTHANALIALACARCAGAAVYRPVQSAILGSVVRPALEFEPVAECLIALAVNALMCPIAVLDRIARTAAFRSGRTACVYSSDRTTRSIPLRLAEVRDGDDANTCRTLVGVRITPLSRTAVRPIPARDPVPAVAAGVERAERCPAVPPLLRAQLRIRRRRAPIFRTNVDRAARSPIGADSAALHRTRLPAIVLRRIGPAVLVVPRAKIHIVLRHATRDHLDIGATSAHEDRSTRDHP